MCSRNLKSDLGISRRWICTTFPLLFLIVSIPKTEAKQKYTIIYVSNENHDSKDEFSKKLEVLKVMRKSSKDTYKTMFFSPSDHKLAESFFEFLSKQDEKATPPKTPGDFLMVKGPRYFLNAHRTHDAAELERIEILSDNYKPIVVSTYSENIIGWNKLSDAKQKLLLKSTFRSSNYGNRLYYVLPDISSPCIFKRASNLDDLKPYFLEFLRSHGFGPLSFNDGGKSFLMRRKPKKSKRKFIYNISGRIAEILGMNDVAIDLRLHKIKSRVKDSIHDCDICLDSSINKIPILSYAITEDYIYLRIKFSLFFADWEMACQCFKTVSPESVPRLIPIEKKAALSGKAVVIDRWINLRRTLVEGNESH